jgi:hypothetical protein
MTRASFDVCAKVEEYLAKRCANKNANVKLKALVVIRHVAEKGAPQFKQQMVRRLPVIKDCQQFSGPPDPLRGDEPYRRVRMAAKDAIEALTSDDYDQPVAQSMQGFSGGGDAYESYPPQRGRMEGFGNSIPDQEPTTYMAKAQRMASQMAEKAASRLQKSDSGYRGGDQRRSAEFSSHRSMPGVGNPRFGDARHAPPSWTERVQEGARQAASHVEKMRFGTSSTESFDPSYTYASNRGANAYGGDRFQAPASSNTQDWGDRRRGNVGGGWGNTNTPQPPPRQSAPSYEAHTTSTSSSAGRAGGAATDGAYERHLVQDLCGAGGTRAAPPPDKLRAFVENAATLDADAVGPALLEELDDAKPWQSRAKACAVVEALCRADGCEHHLGYFSEVADDLQGLESASNLALRKQARRMLSALGVAGDAPAAPRRAPPPSSTEADLLGGFAEPAAAAPSLLDEFGGEPAAAAPAAAPPSLLDEFGGGAPAPPAAAPAPPPAPPAPAGLFGNLSVKETSPPPPKTEEEPPSLLDAFSASLENASTAVSDAFPATAAAAADVFGSGELAPAAPAPPPPPPQDTPKSPVSPGGDPFAALTGLPLTREDKYHAATAGRTGPAFVAPQSQQQMWQQQQQYQQQQYQQQQAWQQQQWLRQQQMSGGPPSFTAAPPMMPGRAAAIPPAAPGESPSGFAFMGAPAPEADSFGFVSDMIGAKK